MIAKQDILDRAAEWGLRPEIVEKDYVLGWLLAAISQHTECRSRWIFKGGTCLKKCFFETYRFSEDLDFTLLPEAAYSSDVIQRSLTEVAARAYDLSGIQFRDATVKSRHNKQGQETFEGRIYYQGPLQMPNWPKVSFDLSRHETVYPPFDWLPIFHPYPDDLPGDALIQTYSFPELLGEKMRALVERTRPRDLYDVVYIVENRRDEIDLKQTRELFLGKCRAKSLTPPSSHELLQLVRGSGELRADWEGMLVHQLPQLPPIDAVLGRLDGLFGWIAEEATAAPLRAPLERIPLGRGEVIRAPRGVEYWGTPTSGLEAIRFAGANRLLVEFDYTDQRGNFGRRLVEPYSLRSSSAGNLLLYTFDRHRGQVRSFSVSGIRNVNVTKQVFVPQRIIELTSSGPIHAPAVERSAGYRQSRSSGGQVYVYACALCSREFRHSEQNPRLKKHRTAEGLECSGRRGYFVRSE